MKGTPVSRAEALRIARRIIERAERERLELAAWEAQRGPQWDDEGLTTIPLDDTIIIKPGGA